MPPIRSLDLVDASYRLHGANDYLSIGVDPEWLRWKIALIERGHEHVRRLASELGIDGVPPRATDLRDGPGPRRGWSRKPWAPRSPGALNAQSG